MGCALTIQVVPLRPFNGRAAPSWHRSSNVKRAGDSQPRPESPFCRSSPAIWLSTIA